MHIHQLIAQNFKRIKVATVKFPPNGTVEVVGRNGQGKSSLIDSIWAILGGSKASPGQPIRNGSSFATGSLDLGEIRVLREWGEKGSRLTVTNAQGYTLGSPQKLLDGLFSRLAFDPMEFTRQKPSDQAATLRKVVGLDFTKLDQERAGVYQQRTEVNRAVKASESILWDMPEVEPAEEISAAALTEQLRAATAQNRAIADADRAVQRKEDEITACKREIRSYEAKLAEMRGRLTEAETDLGRLQVLVGEEQDTTEIMSQIAQVDQTNRRARAYRERQAAEERLRAIREESEDLTTRIEEIDTQRHQMLTSAKFPVPGLSLDGDVVTLGGIPFAQVSTSEQIRVSLAMSAALNPTLKLIVIKEGSLLDESNLRLVAAWAEEHDYQVIVERVADSAVGPGVMITDGVVADADREAVPVGADSGNLF
jgi:DNA repair exonuclease SbcCD ATPase subunit